MKKKAQSSFGIFHFIIVSLVVVLMFAGYIYVSGILNDVFREVGVKNDEVGYQNMSFPCVDNNSATCTGNFYVNMTLASEQIFGVHYQSIQALRMVAIVYILAMAVIIVLTGFFERKHPILFFAYILIGLLAVIFAPLISNAYESLLTTNLFGGELLNFTQSNFIILNLPTVVLVIFVLGAIGLFINLVRGGSNETGL